MNLEVCTFIKLELLPFSVIAQYIFKADGKVTVVGRCQQSGLRAVIIYRLQSHVIRQSSLRVGESCHKYSQEIHITGLSRGTQCNTSNSTNNDILQ